MSASIGSISSSLTSLPMARPPVMIALSSKAQTKQSAALTTNDIAPTPTKQAISPQDNLILTVGDSSASAKLKSYFNSQGQEIGTIINVVV